MFAVSSKNLSTGKTSAVCEGFSSRAEALAYAVKANSKPFTPFFFVVCLDDRV